MKLFRKDPIVKKIHEYYEEISNSDTLEQDLERIILGFFRNSEILKAVAYGYYAQKKYPNNTVFRLNYFDSLMLMGFFFDAQYYIEELFFSKNIKTVLIVERLIELYLQQAEYLKVIDLCQNNLNVVLKSEKALRLYLDMLKRINRFDLYNFIVKNFYERVCKILKSDVVLLDYVDEKISLIDLYNEGLNNTKDNLNNIVDKIWRLFHQGERSLQFFRLAVKKYDTESPIGLRQIFFLNEARKFYSDNIEFLFEYYQNMCFRKFFELVYYDLMSLDIYKILLNPLISQNKRSKLYYFYIKICTLVKDNDSTLLSFEEACQFDLIEPYTLELTRHISIKISLGSIISELDIKLLQQLPSNYKKQCDIIFSSISPKKIEYMKGIDLLLVGQMRGGDKAVNDIKQMDGQYNFDYIAFSTWDTQPLFPPRFNSIKRSLGFDVFRRIPVKYSHPYNFQQKFIEFTDKINNSSNIKFAQHEFEILNRNIDFLIKNESDFDKEFNRKEFFIADKLHQAKMFYHFSNIRKANGNSNVILRKRPDVKPYFHFNLKDYFHCLNDESNYAYITYFDHNLGFADRFLLGTHDAIYNMSLIWDNAVSSDKLIYADFFDEFTHVRAAEHLISSHAIATGVKIRYIHCYKEDFIQADSLKFIELKKEFNSDYEKLNFDEKLELHGFYEYMNKILI